MSTVGTVIRDPGIVRMPFIGSFGAITRGQLVQWSTANLCMQLVPATAGQRALGIALSDGDPDTGDIAVAVRSYTVPVVPAAGYVPATGDVLYASLVTAGAVSSTVNGTPIGWCINNQLSAQGTIEMGLFYV